MSSRYLTKNVLYFTKLTMFSQIHSAHLKCLYVCPHHPFQTLKSVLFFLFCLVETEGTSPAIWSLPVLSRASFLMRMFQASWEEEVWDLSSDGRWLYSQMSVVSVDTIIKSFFFVMLYFSQLWDWNQWAACLLQAWMWWLPLRGWRE